MTARGAGIVVVALLVVSALGAAVDALSPAQRPPPPQPVAQEPATAGMWYCPMTGGSDDAAVLSVSAVGTTETTITVIRATPEGPVVGDPKVIAAGGVYETALQADAAGQPVTVRWSGGPAAASMRLRGPGGTAAAPCADGPSERWLLTGLDTAAGASSLLHLYNPFSTDAVVRVAFATAEGRVDLVLTDSLLVPASSALRVDLGRYEPERPDLGVVVDVRAGRVIAGGEVRLDPPGDEPGPTGRALLPAAPEGGLSWGFADARQSELVDSHLSLMNPGERDAAVEVRVSDPRPDGSAFAGEVSVPAGGVVRLALSETSAVPEFGVWVQAVNEVPVVAAMVSDVRGDGGREITATTGTAGAAARWALIGAGTAMPSAVVAVHNPGQEAAIVDLVAAGAPSSWQQVPIGPNQRVAFPLQELEPLPETGGPAVVAVRVDGDRPVVADLRVTADGAAQAWSTVGVPAGDWTGPPLRPAVLRDPTLSGRPMTAGAAESAP